MNKIQRVVAKNLGCAGGLEYCNAEMSSQYLHCRIEAVEAERFVTAEAENVLSMPSAFLNRQSPTKRQHNATTNLPRVPLARICSIIRGNRGGK